MSSAAVTIGALKVNQELSERCRMTASQQQNSGLFGKTSTRSCLRRRYNSIVPDKLDFEALILSFLSTTAVPKGFKINIGHTKINSVLKAYARKACAFA